MKRFVSALVLSLAATAVVVSAQVDGGSIGGTVKDVQGNAVAGVDVVAESADGKKFKGKTNGQGEYGFQNLPPGKYAVSASGEKQSSNAHDVSVAAGRNTALNLEIKFGENVVISGTPAPLVDATDTGISTTINFERLSRIPDPRDTWGLTRTAAGVVIDQANVAGNETGTQPVMQSKGARPQDTTISVDGIDLTDAAAPGQSPFYPGPDIFDEMRISTAGNEITTRTGGLAIDIITKRGGNSLRGGFRSYFSNDDLEWSNVPDELKATVTPDKADHTIQNADYGFEIGGPIIRDRLWFFTAVSQQDIRLHRRTTSTLDKTVLRNPQVKVNWHITDRTLFNFLFLNGYKIKSGRSNPANGTTFEAPEATHHQDNAYSDSPFHGMWKLGLERVVSPDLFVSAKYSYFNTGLKLTPEGGMDAQAGRNVPESRAYGSTVQSLNVRPQHYVGTDATQILGLFGLGHTVKYGFAFRHVYNESIVEWPGNGILGIVNAQDPVTKVPTDLRAQVFRQSRGANTVNYLDFYVGDRIQLRRATLDVGLRYDRQWGDAVASVTAPNKGLPEVVPGAVFTGYESPFTWSNFSPRVGGSYLLGESGRTVVRASYSRFAGQLNSALVGTRNTSTGSTPGNATYVWNDLNGDRYAQAEEVDLTKLLGSGNGFNPANPTALAPSANQFGPLEAPVTQSTIAGVEHELTRDLVVFAGYTYNRVTSLFGNLSGNLTPRVGVPLDAYTKHTVLTGFLPDGEAYSVQTYRANGVTAGFITQTVPDYYIDYNGLEFNATKRLSNRWMGSMSIAYNNGREHLPTVASRYNTNGNPTGTAADPLIDGGQLAPTANAAQGVFLNAKWTVNVNGMYEAPYGIQVAANVFGRQGYPFPVYRGGISLANNETSNVLVTPRMDYFRLDDVWLTDLRVARDFKFARTGQSVTFRLVADTFNLFNVNTALTRVNNIGGLGDNGNLTTPATNFNTITKNVSPRIMRFGLVVTF